MSRCGEALDSYFTLTISELAWKHAHCEYKKEIAPSQVYVRSGSYFMIYTRDAASPFGFPTKPHHGVL